MMKIKVMVNLAGKLFKRVLGSSKNKINWKDHQMLLIKILFGGYRVWTFKIKFQMIDHKRLLINILIGG